MTNTGVIFEPEKWRSKLEPAPLLEVQIIPRSLAPSPCERAAVDCRLNLGLASSMVCNERLPCLKCRIRDIAILPRFKTCDLKLYDCGVACIAWITVHRKKIPIDFEQACCTVARTNNNVAIVYKINGRQNWRDTSTRLRILDCTQRTVIRLHLFCRDFTASFFLLSFPASGERWQIPE